MPITAKSPLSDGTLNRDWHLDVNTGTFAAPVWTAVNGVTEITPKFKVNFEDVSDNDSDGASYSQATGYEWGVNATVRRGLTADGSFDPGQETLRLLALDGGRLDIRIYQVNDALAAGEGEAYRGQINADWSPKGGGSKGVEMVDVVLNGQGRRNSTPHPGMA